MKPIRLDEPNHLPADYRARFAPMEGCVRSVEWMDRLLDFPDFRRLAADLDAWILERKVLAYHCTKELHPGLFTSCGLRPLNMGEHIAEFHQTVVPSLSPELQKRFREEHEAWLHGPRYGQREGMIWFCLSPYLVKDEGTSYFFRYFGGECIYWPFLDDPFCLQALEKIGRPVVVEVALPAKDFEILGEMRFARTILSHYARRINSCFQLESLEGWVGRPVDPSEIVTVHEKEVFWTQYWPGVEKTSQ